jgi:hypothetical protein
VFALATPKSSIDRGTEMANAVYLNGIFCFSLLLSNTRQGRVWNQITQPELVANCAKGLIGPNAPYPKGSNGPGVRQSPTLSEGCQHQQVPRSFSLTSS